MTRRGTVKRVGVWSPCGTGNMGNEMTVAALVQNLRRLEPDIDLRAFSANPADTSERYGIPSFPMMREGGAGSRGLVRVVRHARVPLLESVFAHRSRRSLRDLDLLVFAGTGILTDSWGGAARFPYNVFKWSHLAAWSGARVAVVSAGAGPLQSHLSRRLIRGAFGHVAYRSFRDEYSRQLVQRLGVDGDNRVCPDLAFSLVLADGEAAQDEHPTEVAIVGLPFRKPGRWENASQEAYDRYLNAMASFASWLLAGGYTIRLVPTHVRMDKVFIADLISRLERDHPGSAEGRLVTETAETFEQIAAQLSRAGIVVSSRFHGVVFAYLLGKPVLGISYHVKMNELMKDFGQEEFCVDLPTMDVGDLRARFTRLANCTRSAGEAIRRTVERHRHALAEQYETLLSL